MALLPVDAIEVVLLSSELVDPPNPENQSEGLLFLFPIDLSLGNAMDVDLDEPGVLDPDFLLGISGGGVLNQRNFRCIKSIKSKNKQQIKVLYIIVFENKCSYKINE